MKPRRSGQRRELTARAHAKINLTLRVVDARPDGYHGLQTIFQSLALHDTLTLTPADGPFALTCSEASLPTDGGNLVSRAATLLWEAAGGRGTPGGVRLHLRKRIPMQGGLGGGSADAAAALVALDAFWATSLPATELVRLARCLGADVPFFLCGGTALGLDRGDEMYPLEELPRTAVVLVFPPFGVATPEAFRWFDQDASDGARPATSGARPGILLDGVPVAIHNDLEGPVARRHPAIARIRRALDRSGATAAAMTGSGSTVFGLYRAPSSAREAVTALEGAGWRAVSTRTMTRQEARPSASLVWKRFSRIH